MTRRRRRWWRGGRGDRRRRGERGVGLIASVAGVTVVLALLTFAVQLTVNLYAASVVTSAAHEAARLAASGADRSDAEARARSMLGPIGDDTRFEWDVGDPDVVALRIVADAPRVLLPVVDGALGLDVIDRTVRVRVEAVQP